MADKNNNVIRLDVSLYVRYNILMGSVSKHEISIRVRESKHRYTV